MRRKHIQLHGIIPLIVFFLAVTAKAQPPQSPKSDDTYVGQSELPVPPGEIREFMDLQTHCTMKSAYGWFEQGLSWFDEENPPEIGHKHLFTTTNYANFLADNPGCRIIINGAILPEVLVSRKRARQRVLDQLAYVNDFAERHSDDFAVAKSPQEVRDLILNTDKTVIIHSIEGGKRLLDGPEDARFWADQGVAFITLIHLIDDEFGGAAVAPDITTRIINYKGGLRKSFTRKPERGLTEKGKNAIQWLADAGVMIDLTHMSGPSRTQALAYMEEHQIPALVTHDLFKPIQNQPRGVPPEDLKTIYRTGGLMSMPVSGVSCTAHHPEEKYQKRLDSLEKHCPGSIDSYKFTYESVKELVQDYAVELQPGNGADFSEWNETNKLDWAIGFETDFDGWLNHHHPRYGEEGCWELEAGVAYEPIETEGLRHPGLMESHWRLLRKENVDLEPILRASEKFLQMWEHFLENKNQD